MTAFHLTEMWQQYLQLIKTRPEAFQNGDLEIITDEKLVDRFAQTTENRPGLWAASPFYLHIADLVRRKDDPEGELFLYERMLPTVAKGAVAAVPICKGSFVLLKQYRHAIRETALCLPRGFAEPGFSPEENLRKELSEEIRVSNIRNIKKLGSVAADSGILGTIADIFSCEVDGPALPESHEGIREIVLIDPDRILGMIRAGEITDGFTLSAMMLWFSANRK